MDIAKLHWEILQGLGTDLANRVRSFMVIGNDGDGVIVATEDGLAFWLGEMRFVWNVRSTIKPILLKVPELVQMAQGRNRILLLNRRGEIYSMGKNDEGQLGLGTDDNETYYLPQLIPSPHKFISVRCGDVHSVALTDDGKVWAWGWNGCRQVGMNISASSHFSPRQILKLNSHRIVAVECGSAHSLALTDQGEVYAWGWNDSGQLGNWSEEPPIRFLTPSPVRSMAAGYYHTLLLTQTGEVYACGDNSWGQLGFPATTELSASLFKVAGLPPISQIASHPLTNLSIAMSSDQRCFVWGQLSDKIFNEKNNCISVSTPRELPSFYSTVESPLSFYSRHLNTPHSVSIPETPPSPLSVRMSRMFDNPETSPDVQFVVEQRTIHAHRIILSNSSDYFARMFSERWMALVDPENPIIKVTISDHSYQVFHAFLRFLYIDSLEVYPDLLPELFELSCKYLESNLQQLCLTRMSSSLSPATCCLYYPLTVRHTELDTFQQDIVQFVSTQMSKIAATSSFQSMEPNLRYNLTNAAQNFSVI